MPQTCGDLAEGGSLEVAAVALGLQGLDLAYVHPSLGLPFVDVEFVKVDSAGDQDDPWLAGLDNADVDDLVRTGYGCEFLPSLVVEAGSSPVQEDLDR